MLISLNTQYKEQFDGVDPEGIWIWSLKSLHEYLEILRSREMDYFINTNVLIELVGAPGCEWIMLSMIKNTIDKV